MKYVMQAVAVCTVGSLAAIAPAAVMGEWEIVARLFVCSLVGSALCSAWQKVNG